MKTWSTFKGKIETTFSQTSAPFPCTKKRDLAQRSYAKPHWSWFEMKCKFLYCQHTHLNSKQNQNILQESLPSHFKPGAVMTKIRCWGNTRNPRLLCRWTQRCINFQGRWTLTFLVQSTPASQWSLWLLPASQGTELLFWAHIPPSHLWETIEKVKFWRWFSKGFLSLFCNSRLFLWHSAYKGMHSDIRGRVRMQQNLS